MSHTGETPAPGGQPQAATITIAEWTAMQARDRAPVLLDMRAPHDFQASEWLLAGARRLDPRETPDTDAARGLAGPVVVVASDAEAGAGLCERLRLHGCAARALAGPGATLQAAVQARAQPSTQPVLRLLRKRPDLGVDGLSPSRWITRSRPKVDRIACAWLIRRFIDPDASIRFVAREQALAVAQAEGAVAFDVYGGPITHQWERCSFDALLQAFGLDDPVLTAMARIVRAADTTRLSVAPQAAGLLAVSLGLSQHHDGDDDGMLRSASALYDGLYAWCVAGSPMRHDWREHVVHSAAAGMA